MGKRNERLTGRWANISNGRAEMFALLGHQVCGKDLKERLESPNPVNKELELYL